MKRVAKPAGKFNVVLEEVPVPEPGPHEVRVHAVRSLISRGSELWRRYIRPEPIDPKMMGYSLAGVVDAVGGEVTEFAPGDRVAVSAPHAQYVLQDARIESSAHGPRVTLIDERVTFDQAPFWGLTTSSVLWVEAEAIQPDDTVVIVGQGLVGSLMLQVAKANGPGRLIAVDALDLRCDLAAQVGADEVINASKDDPVAAVQELTDGQGAQVVAYTVGGAAGPAAFAQCLDMLALGGLLQVVGLYEDAPLPLDSSKIQRKRLLGGYPPDSDRVWGARRSMELLVSGAIHADRMITHHFPYTQAPDAFRLLYEKPGETMAVELDWDGNDA